MTSYCRTGIALQSISHDFPLQCRHWQCCVTMCIWFDFQEASLHISFLPNHKLAQLSELQHLLRTRTRRRDSLNSKHCWKIKKCFHVAIYICCRFNASPLELHWADSLHVKVESRGFCQRNMKKTYSSFMNTLISIYNFISSVMTLCTFSKFCIKMIMFTWNWITLIIYHFICISYPAQCSMFSGQKIRDIFPTTLTLGGFSGSFVLLFHGRAVVQVLSVAPGIPFI